jgi:Fe-S-cluster containining protein
LLTDLVEIRRQGEKKREENEKLRRHLKRHVFVERRLRIIAQDIEDSTDCTKCANCCRVATVRLTERDIERIAKSQRISRERFLADYTTETEDEGRILNRSDETGCTFLHGNECLIYEDRPATCQDFPHLVKGNGSLVARMWDMPDRATYCPIVYNTLEAFKTETKFHEKSG